jgi:hypothetical protein
MARDEDIESAIVMREIILQQDLRALANARRQAAEFELAAEHSWYEVRRLESYSQQNQTALEALRAQQLASTEVM